MKLHYQFDLKFQLLYGFIAAVVSFALLFLILNKSEWVTACVVGIGNFLVSGFYTEYCRKC